MSKMIQCTKCHETYDETLDACPHCGEANQHTNISETPKRRRREPQLAKLLNIDEENNQESTSKSSDMKDETAQKPSDKEAPTTKNEKQEKKPNVHPTREKKKSSRKWSVIVVILLALVGAGLLGKKYADAKEAERLEKVEQAYQKTTLAFEKLYFDEQHIFLNAGITEDKILRADKRIDAVDNDAYQKELTKMSVDIHDRFKKQQSINQYYENNYIVGNTLNDQAILKENVDEILTRPVNSEKDEFDKMINHALEETKLQLKVRQEAQKAVKALMNDDKQPKENLTKKEIDEANQLVQQVTHPKIKTSLNDSMKQIILMFDEQEAKKKEEQEAAKKKEEEENRKKLEAEKAQKQKVNPQDDPNASDAWAWAPGVKEQVLAECLRRGYIVDGGYTLVKKEIRDGQGYYDLYATNAESPLLQPWPKAEMPFYLVTINCKTGWFKGNGTDGTR
ncbi:cell division site-positioning protein MapZ family protein [Vagococcus lutrae]|uniref:cell division site-positioning protein MapZ family protein n=1 Tax=Vagococcus lutrae TaxID=81947 RepID=UPI002A80B291|nr:cell division site-positioning protein MapZ family protein [Vagococcus lutrae]MDY3706732.1 cell division site-positioning protein MapZ family protein [Vagococcus lutrae]